MTFGKKKKKAGFYVNAKKKKEKPPRKNNNKGTNYVQIHCQMRRLNYFGLFWELKQKHNQELYDRELLQEYILKGIDKGEILSSGASQVSKDGSVGLDVQPRRTKPGSREDLPLGADNHKDETADGFKGKTCCQLSVWSFTVRFCSLERGTAAASPAPACSTDSGKIARRTSLRDETRGKGFFWPASNTRANSSIVCIC